MLLVSMKKTEHTETANPAKVGQISRAANVKGPKHYQGPQYSLSWHDFPFALFNLLERDIFYSVLKGKNDR